MQKSQKNKIIVLIICAFLAITYRHNKIELKFRLSISKLKICTPQYCEVMNKKESEKLHKVSDILKD